MRGTLSPILSHLAQTTISAVGEKEKLNRLINRYRKMLRYVHGGFNISEIRFGLADLLITRDEPQDWKEARDHYDYVLDHATYGYIRSAAIIGKAELAVRSTDKKEIEGAVELAQRAYKNLSTLVGPSDFYAVKCLVVEAELRIKRLDKNDKSCALKLFERTFSDKTADPYFTARAIAGHAELLLHEKKKNIANEIKLCYKAAQLLKERPNDYFSIKAKLLQGELISQRMKRYDKSMAIGIFTGIINNKAADSDLAARAKLDLADISDKPKAKKLVRDVLSTKSLDLYLVERARSIDNLLKERK